MDPHPKTPSETVASQPTSTQQNLSGRGRHQHHHQNQHQRGSHPGRGYQGRGNQFPGRSPGGPVSIAPSSGIPYGHVPGYLPGSSSLVEDLDQRMLIVLRDGRHLVGVRKFPTFWFASSSFPVSLFWFF